jgi:solute carrier family 25 carnitine/acylcarnitine transporter 20/29
MSEALKSFLSGGFGGICLVFAGHPLDTIKVRLMNDKVNQYKGTFDCVKQTLKADGIKGLYRGMAAPVVGITPIFAVYFMGYDLGKDIAVGMGMTGSDGKISTGGIMFAGGFSALPGTAVMVPGDRVKVLLQIQGMSKEPPKYDGPIDCFKKVVKEDGVKGLYKGTALTLLRDGPGSVAYYGAYEIFKRALSPKEEGAPMSPFAVITAGGLAGISNWLVAVPPDVIKTRFQTAEPGRYSGMGQVASELIQKEGIGSLYKGIAPALLRAFPANAACFLGMEVSKKALTNMGL